MTIIIILSILLGCFIVSTIILGIGVVTYNSANNDLIDKAQKYSEVIKDQQREIDSKEESLCKYRSESRENSTVISGLRGQISFVESSRRAETDLHAKEIHDYKQACATKEDYIKEIEEDRINLSNHIKKLSGDLNHVRSIVKQFAGEKDSLSILLASAREELTSTTEGKYMKLFAFGCKVGNDIESGILQPSQHRILIKDACLVYAMEYIRTHSMQEVMLAAEYLTDHLMEMAKGPKVAKEPKKKSKKK